MKPFSILVVLTFYGYTNQKEKMVGLQAAVKKRMDSVQSNKAAILMQANEWSSEKAWDSITRTAEGRVSYDTLEKQYEQYNSLFKQLSKQYDSLEVEIQRH